MPLAAVHNVDSYGDDVPVPIFDPRMVCTRCGIIGANARPNWREQVGHQMAKLKVPADAATALSVSERLLAAIDI
jgi:hypothetical protein